MVHLVLEDGRGLWRSTVVMAGVYHLVANAVNDNHPRFKRWLADMSDRPVPFMDFDLRGLPEECRAEFHRAAKSVRDSLLADLNAGQLRADEIEPFETLVRMKESMVRGEPPQSFSDDDDVQAFDGVAWDLDEIWAEDGGSAVA